MFLRNSLRKIGNRKQFKPPVRLWLQGANRYNFSNDNSQDQVLDFSKPDPKKKQIMIGNKSEEINCLMLHPIFYPNKGPTKELYMAEEAIGLVKSLDWTVLKGPFWREEYDDSFRESVLKEGEGKKNKKKTGITSDASDVENGGEKIKPKRGRRRRGKEGSYEREFWDETGNNYEVAEDADLKDGDYVYTPIFKGVYYKGGVIVDQSTDSMEDEIFHEWKNKILRESLAKSSLIKVRNIKAKTFFTKGKLHTIGEFLRDNNINAVFVNTELSTSQTRNLEKMWSNVLNGRPMLRTRGDEGIFDSDAESQASESEAEVEKEHKTKGIKVFDRFTIILQIFAKRAKTKIARIQIELSFLQYLKSKLMRSPEGKTYSSLYSIFHGDLMSAQEIKLEVVSARQRRASGQMTGEGETQLEIERRLIGEKEAKLRSDLEKENKNRLQMKQKRRSQINVVPHIALIGYTNSGKSALMNQLRGEETVVSENILFQTLNTIKREIQLNSGQKAHLLDTIGFITELPHELVESFKCTLEEVSNADLVLHVRDVSHPNNEDQKNTVLSVLKELKFEHSFYTDKMIEVWNKIDLLEEPIDYDQLTQSEFPIVPISALHGTNCEKLVEIIEEKVNLLMGKKVYALEHSIDDHGDRVKWFFANANISHLNDVEFDYTQTKKYPSGKAIVRILLDEATFRRYQAQYNSGFDREERRLNKGMPPPGWNKAK